MDYFNLYADAGAIQRQGRVVDLDAILAFNERVMNCVQEARPALFEEIDEFLDAIMDRELQIFYHLMAFRRFSKKELRRWKNKNMMRFMYQKDAYGVGPSMKDARKQWKKMIWAL